MRSNRDRSNSSEHDILVHRRMTGEPRVDSVAAEVTLLSWCNYIARSRCDAAIAEHMSLIAASRDAIAKSRQRLALAEVFHL